MKIPKKVWDQISYLCSQISNIEWSAILFYKTEGEVTDIANFKIEAKEVYLKDIGTVGFTSFTFGSDEVERMMSNEELMDYTIGKIHSHHNMNTFHSGTDWDDLWENTETNNLYLSFITNNRFDLEVKVGWRAVQKVVTKTEYYITDPNGVVIPQVMEEEKEDYMFIVADGEIEVENDNIPEQWFIDRLEEIQKRKAKQKAAETKAAENVKKLPPTFDTWKNNEKVLKEAPQRYTKKEVEKITTPTAATHNFLAKFISMGGRSSVQEAIEAVDNLHGSDFAAWEDNIMEGQLWNGMYERYFGKDTSQETQVAEQCLKILEKYKKEYPGVIKVLVGFLDDISVIDVEEYYDSKDIPTALFNDAYAEHIDFMNNFTS